MSAEREPSHQERHESSSAELESARQEQLEKLHQTPENAPDHAETRAEEAREVINRVEPAAETAPPSEQESKPGHVPFLNHKLNYVSTLASIQHKLKPLSRSFSRVIHTPLVERTSEVLEKTVARPSVTLGATWTALILGSLFYFAARRYGYALSGSEIILSFVVGAVLGLLLEGVWHVVKPKRS